MHLDRLTLGAAKAPKTAMVLCAGRGERMRPLTDTRPKPLIELDGVTLLDRILDHCADTGVERAVVNAHYLADQIEASLSARAHPAITLSREEVALETGGGIVRALPLLGDAPFLAINGDSVWFDGMSDTLTRLASGWNDAEMDVLLLLYPFARTIGEHGRGDFTMDPLGRLERRAEGFVVPYTYMGVSIVHPRALADAPDGPFSMNLIYDRAQEAGRLFGQLHDGLWYHISTPDDLETARERFASGHAPPVPFF